MNRQQYLTAYRRARLVARFISDVHIVTGVHVSSMYPTLHQCPGFSFSRLSGDQLKLRLVGIVPRDLSCHRRLLSLIGSVQPVLP